MLYGFNFINKTISEFTVREGQIGSKIISDDYLINELKILKREKNRFFNFFINHNLHYEISIFSTLKIVKTIGNIITLKYFLRSIKFKLWKSFRFNLNPKLLNFLFRIFN